MAQRTYVELIDDLDGKEAAETVTFGIEWVEYEIDLLDENADKLRKVLCRDVGAARWVGGRKATKAKGSSPSDARSIREWAKRNGYDVPERGRIPEGVREAYRAANAA